MYAVGTLDQKQDETPVTYKNKEAHYWTVTDEGLEAFYQARRETATEVNYWVAEKKTTRDRDYAKFCKEQEKDCRRFEKAANIWIKHFTEVGLKNLNHYPAELKQELNLVFNRALLA